MKPTTIAQEDIELYEDMRPVHVQTVLPKKIRDALMRKTGSTSIMDAVNKAVYCYLKCEVDDKQKT